MTLSNGSDYDTSLITSFTSSSRTFTIESSDYTLAGSYELTITGALTSYPSVYDTATFTLTVTDPCDGNTLTINSLSAQTYLVGSGSTDYTFSDWS